MLAAPLVARAIAARGCGSSAIDATEVIVTTDQFGGAEPLMDETRVKMQARVRPLIERGESPVLTGFIGATVDGVLTTLGRGGSDYSASIVGAALDADEIWIWTDVDGVLSANPAEVPTHGRSRRSRTARHRSSRTTARRCCTTRRSCPHFASASRSAS